MNNPLKKIFETKNKIHYFALDSNEKSNYILIKDMMFIFQNDFYFLDNVLKHKNSSLTKIEKAELYYDMLYIIYNNYKDNEDVQKYYGYYSQKLDLLINELYKIDLNNYNPSDENKVFFEEVLYNEEYSENVACFIAKDIVNKIFSSFGLEKYLHEEFLSYEEFEQFGIDEFIFDIIDRYDLELSLFSFHHKIVLENIYNLLNKIKKNWDNYCYKEKDNKYLKLKNKLKKYRENNNIRYYEYYDLLYYTAYKLNILGEFFFQSNNELIEPDFNNLNKVYDKCKIIDEKNNFTFLKHYLKLKEIFKKELDEKIGDEFINRQIKTRNR